MRPQPATDYSGMSRSQAMQSMYSSEAVDISQHVNKPLDPDNVKRGIGAAVSLGGGPITAAVKIFIYQPLKYALMDYLGDKLNPQTPDVVVDKYTESILAEVMSSQQTESKLGSAPSFVRPKKKKKLLYE